LLLITIIIVPSSGTKEKEATTEGQSHMAPLLFVFFDRRQGSCVLSGVLLFSGQLALRNLHLYGGLAATLLRTPEAEKEDTIYCIKI
jgi:hypothetical protein